MKVVFVGPTLPERVTDAFADRLAFRPPAQFGDVARAVLAGATAIGLIDGFFEDRAAVWHKELLYALAQGVRVFGAASMGALRAAECSVYGMIGIGEVFDRYARGELIDDDAVAQIHGPPEMRHMALSEPLVNIEATGARLRAAGLISVEEARDITAAARRCFFKERSMTAAIEAAIGLSGDRRAELHRLFALHRRDVKAEDAMELLRAIDAVPDCRIDPPATWHFAETRIWRRLLEQQRQLLNPATPQAGSSSAA